MLSFLVEELGPDNRARRVFECSGQHAPHAIPIEMMRDLRPGQQIHVPILLAEVCPRNAVFLRAGLHRVTPKLDPSIDGEGLKVDPWVADALARQAVLVRLASAQEGYYIYPPKAGGVSASAGPGLERDGPAVEPPPAKPAK